MRKIVLATKNKGKATELGKILGGFEILTLIDMEIDTDIEENGQSFEENALIKAREISRITGEITVADDSGLEVFFLNMRPGIYSARYAGENASDEERVNKLLDEMKDVYGEKRGARFVCGAAAVLPDGREKVFQGECYGIIANSPIGEGGFGYDPVFIYPDLGLTFAQMDENKKNEISHRSLAFGKLSAWLLANL